jgi:hypothetical protein
MDYAKLYSDFLASADTLQLYRDGVLAFASQQERLLPLYDYLNSGGDLPPVVVFDKVMGNAAALLTVLAHGREVFSPLGSQLAVATLKANGIAYHLDKTVPRIMQADGENMCPMEALSIGKTPPEFYKELKERIEGSR